ncbi:hypothetical protein XENORESO_007667, partial [Xenotaenia resolanae]
SHASPHGYTIPRILQHMNTKLPVFYQKSMIKLQALNKALTGLYVCFQEHEISCRITSSNVC